MRIAEAIKLLAAPFADQERVLGNIPENTSSPGFDIHNDVFRMVILLLDSLCVSEGDGGSEGLESWRTRTQIPADLHLPTNLLATALRMLVDLNKPFLFTRHGLRSAHEWRLIRHLAGEVCDTMKWSRDLQYSNFDALWNELGNGVVELPNRIKS
jgi:hypothetical protein